MIAQAAAKREQAAKQAAKAAAASLAPQDMFRAETAKYSQFDADGVPTHDAEGEALSKGSMKKLRKLWEKQLKIFEKK